MATAAWVERDCGVSAAVFADKSLSLSSSSSFATAVPLPLLGGTTTPSILSGLSLKTAATDLEITALSSAASLDP